MQTDSLPAEPQEKPVRGEREAEREVKETNAKGRKGEERNGEESKGKGKKGIKTGQSSKQEYLNINKSEAVLKVVLMPPVMPRI